MNKELQFRRASRKYTIGSYFVGIGLLAMFAGFLTVPFDGPWGMTVLGIGILMLYGGMAGQQDAEEDLKRLSR
ncbi:hypothetical protein SEA_NICEHOUSE_209 [Rhodococcus phage NiceHouse]|nr:hypothetical protein SEA_NICEHOUSE_209 [Rhodococcus phage NiceHouse]